MKSFSNHRDKDENNKTLVRISIRRAKPLIINPIPAGVHENQDTLARGGVNLTPPSKSHVVCPNMTNDTSLESSCALLLEYAKKLQICEN